MVHTVAVTMDSLPNELYMKITNFLGVEAKRSMRHISHRWKNIIDEKVSFNPQLDDASWTYVKKFRGLIKTLTVRNLTFPSLIENPLIERIIFTSSNLNVNLNMLLLHNNLHHQVDFESGSVPFIPPFPQLCLPNIIAIKIEVKDVVQLENVVSFAKFKLPSLSKVELRISHSYVDVSSYLGVYKFLTAIQSQCPKLKSIILAHSQRSFGLIHSSEQLECKILQVKEIREQFQNLQLEEMSLVFSDLEDFDGSTSGIFSLGIDLLASQVKLVHLELCLMNHIMTEMMDPINQIILNNSQTLRQLQIYSKTTLHVLYYFFCPAIQYCHNLETLELTNFIFQISQFKFPKTLNKLYLSGMASFQSDFEILLWISKNLLSLVQLDVHLYWNQYTIVTQKQSSILNHILEMPNLKRIRILDSSASIFKSFFEMKENAKQRQLKILSSPHDTYPGLIDVYEITLKH